MGVGSSEQSRGVGELDPSTAVTVEEGARLVGTTEESLRGRVEVGEILHETARRGGREVILIRLFDLLDAYPVEGTGVSAARPDRAGSPAAEPVDQAVDQIRVADEVEATPVEGAGPTVEQGAVLARPESEAPLQPDQRGGEPGVERQFRSTESLELRHERLESERRDLELRCAELSERLRDAEAERQANGAGLLLAQKRLAALDGGSATIVISPPWWKRSRTWGVAGILMLAWVFGLQQSRSEAELQALRATLIPAVEEARLSRSHLADQMARREVLFQETLVDLREDALDARVAMLARLDELVGHAEGLSRELDEERSRSATSRALFEEELDAARAVTSGAIDALAEERATRAAEAAEAKALLAEAASERTLLQRSMDERLGRLSDEVRQSREAAAGLAAELDATEAAWESRSSIWASKVSSLELEVGRLEQVQGAQEELDRLRRAIRIAAGAWALRSVLGIPVDGQELVGEL